MTRFISMKRPRIKPLAERNRLAVGAVGILIVVAVVVAAFSYDKMPFIKGTSDYSAYFAEAGGIKPGSDVRVSGLRVGRVSDIQLEGRRCWWTSPSTTASNSATAPRRRSRPRPCWVPRCWS